VLKPIVTLLGCLLFLETTTKPLAAPARFEVGIAKGLPTNQQAGRLFVIVSKTNNPEPRRALGRPGSDAPQAFARDLTSFSPDAPVVVDETAFGFPLTNLSALPVGDYSVQAVFDSNRDLRSPGAPGNLFSLAQKVHLDPARGGAVKLELSRQIPPEQLPPDTEQIKFIKIESPLLSRFHGRPIYLRAGIVLPRDYAAEAARRYPLWVRIGGFNTRYSVVSQMLGNTWMADDTPRFILLQLDGAGPYGDPYYVNSANNGPYGDALIQELIPWVESKFRVLGQARARVLSGTSTGGWVALALQVFYPDFFNGAWASCPDPVDFRAFQLMNIYRDDNAYVNSHGNERPSERDLKGDVTLTMRREVGAENLLGRGDLFTTSGEQWGAWNAVFSPRGADGLPVPLWDPQTGKINHDIAEQTKKYDLRLVLEENWKTLGPKLRGKLHIASGEADQYFLNNAVHLLDEFLREADPPAEAKIVYGPGKGNGGSNLSLRGKLEEMKTATEQKLDKDIRQIN